MISAAKQAISQIICLLYELIMLPGNKCISRCIINMVKVIKYKNCQIPILCGDIVCLNNKSNIKKVYYT